MLQAAKPLGKEAHWPLLHQNPYLPHFPSYLAASKTRRSIDALYRLLSKAKPRARTKPCKTKTDTWNLTPEEKALFVWQNEELLHGRDPGRVLT